jgi:uncharacterized membrane protein
MLSIFVFKVEEMVNLKEKIRAEVRKELEALERRYSTMASVLRELGVVVEGGSCPLLHQVVLQSLLGLSIPNN